MTGPVPVPTFGETDRPKDAVKRALEFLAEAVDDVALVRSRSTLRRVRPPVRMEVHLRGSTWSRRGAGVWCRLSVTVHDDLHGAWRKTHPELTLHRGDLVATFGVVGRSIQLFGPLEGQQTLADVPGFLLREVLPVLDCFESPARAAADLPAQERLNNLLRLVEWAVAREDRAAALEMLRRSFDEMPDMRERTEEQRRTGIPEGTPSGNASDLLGPAITRLGLLAPDEPLP
jgi:hypothetical protein